MQSDICEVERLLKTLTPSTIPIERDRLIYAAGDRDAKAQLRRDGRVWRAFAIAATILAASSLSLHLIQPEEDRSTVPLTTEAHSSGTAANPESTVDRSFLSFQKQPEEDSAIYAFSRIHNVNSWTLQQLQEVGIFVEPGKHTLQNEAPPLQWVQVHFDLTRLPDDRRVVMTAWFLKEDGATEQSSARVESRANQSDLALGVTATQSDLHGSHLDILIWEETAQGSQAHGYTLSLERLLELSREQ